MTADAYRREVIDGEWIAQKEGARSGLRGVFWGLERDCKDLALGGTPFFAPFVAFCLIFRLGKDASPYPSIVRSRTLLLPAIFQYLEKSAQKVPSIGKRTLGRSGDLSPVQD